MPHEKKEEAQTPKRSECDVKSLTHALSSSMYLQISPAKALLLTRAKSMSGPSEVVQGDSEELRKTKEELISRLARKVSDLRKEKEELLKEMSNIEDLGRQVTENVRKSCKTSNVDKYLMYVGDADRVTKLLLSLSRRLAKVNSVLDRLEGNDEEEQKPDLQKMHEDLMGKYEDAKGLKKSIDARHVQISSMLQDHLSPEEYEDFCHFVPMRSRQRITAQELDDRIALGEEQLQALRESLKGEGGPEGEGSQSGAQAS
ncbi:protein Shroom2-like [Acanthaster planci]|uniref:Protein Shroom2-like n=1 Tax=Acanthaster planci TaxID=133434 RepID=A0A8B7Y105_ACAPL|nr:protein Shroom2-like [Acanthaster planci]XP_022086848.1 protein Shroom2-like [Acanthaster planci]